MAKPRSTRHVGVKILELKTGHVARWRCPITKKQKQVSLDTLGLSNAKQRERWCKEKLKALQATKAQLAITHGTSMPVRMSVATAQADYLATFAKINTRQAKTPALTIVAAFLAKNGISDVLDITAPVVAAYGDHVRRPGNRHKESTASLHLLVVAAWLRWCAKRGYLAHLTDEQIKKNLARPKAVSEAPEILQPRQVKQLLRACLAHDEARHLKIGPFAMFVLLTGVRLNEALSLKWNQVDREQQTIELAASQSKTSEHRKITLAQSPTVLELLDRLALAGTRGRVFSGITITEAKNGRRHLTKVYDSGPFTWHMLRRTCGSLMICAEVLGEYMASKRQGHSPAVAEKYYLDTIIGLPKSDTIEQAGGFQDLADAIVRSVAVVTASQRRAAR